MWSNPPCARDLHRSATGSRPPHDERATGQTDGLGADIYVTRLARTCTRNTCFAGETHAKAARRPVADGDPHALADSIIAQITRSFDIAGREVKVGISIGIAFAPLDGSMTDELLAKAADALYRSKCRGRCRYAESAAA